MQGFNSTNKKVFLRADFNVPLDDNQNITDSTRIDKLIPTILECLNNGSNKLIIASHLGRPKAQEDKYSMWPVYEYLHENLNLPNNGHVYFYSKFDSNLNDLINSNMNNGDIVLLENLRFEPGEELCNEEFMKFLAELADVYVNDAFASSHRSHASIMMNKFFNQNDKFYGSLLSNELRVINSLLTDKTRGNTLAIIGGSKVSTKIKLLEQLVKKVDYLFIVGAMANTFLKYLGKPVGKSLVENGQDDTIKNIFDNAKESGCEIMLPVDFVMESKRVAVNDDVLSDDIILDCGPLSIANMENVLNKCNKVIWNGPLGMFENPFFAKGTHAAAKLISEKTKLGQLISILGGGDTIASVNGLKLHFTHVCTAGGAFLEYIENDLKLIGLWK